MEISNTLASDHMEISIKKIKQSAKSDHLLQCICLIKFIDFDILAAVSNKFKSVLSKTVLIKRNQTG